MIRRVTLLGLLLLGWLATGLYVVRGNEHAVVRWCGRARPELVGAGLHLGWPWPFMQVDRINLNEMRTLTIGISRGEEVDDSDFLRPIASSRQGEFLTGDKNILHLVINVQYRVTEPVRFLLQHEDSARHLKFLTQVEATQAVGGSGVDYVHPLGLSELRERITQRVRAAAEKQELGLTVEDVAVAEVRPPVQVQRAFLDVANARAEKERMISEAQAAGERDVARATAESQRLQDEAEGDRHRLLSAGRSEAQRFTALIAQFEQAATSGKFTRDQARQVTQQRMYLEVLEELLPRLAEQVWVSGERPVDLLLPRRPPRHPIPQAPPAAPAVID